MEVKILGYKNGHLKISPSVRKLEPLMTILFCCRTASFLSHGVEERLSQTQKSEVKCKFSK